MDDTIFKLLVVMILFDAVIFYLSFINPPRVLAYYAKGAFFSLTFMLIPFTVFVLWNQSTGGSWSR